MSVQEIRENYEAWWQRRKEYAHDRGEDVSKTSREERVASLEVMGISALEG
jgi:ADP-ribosylation factor related protein 1